ncbi:MAG: hypothetical protein H6606_09705 [Flavobacteriales bacterium]|nr:hypothetical protein [Flavobacteriales bacterium]
MTFLYSAALALMRLLLPLPALFMPGAAKYIRVRRNFREQIRKARLACGEYPVLWFHCASLGEFEMAIPVLESLRATKKYKIVVSFFSPSGYEVRSTHPLIDAAFYLPTDLPWLMGHTVSVLKPSAVFFVKYDFWYNLIRKLHEREIPVYLLNGLLRPGHYLLKPWAAWFRKQIKRFRHVFVQDEQTATYFSGIGVHQCTLTGDLRFDRVGNKEIEELDRLERFKGGKFLLLAGSSWPEEELLLARYLNMSTRDIKIVLVPHDISAGHIDAICSQFTPYGVGRWTDETDHSNKRVLVLDVIGLLRRAYKSADLVFIGGGFSGNVHNVLEAAAVGMPILCGPKSDKFPEIQLMEQGGYLHRVREASDIQRIVAKYADDPLALSDASAKCKAFVHMHQGASQKVLRVLNSELD